MHVSRFEPSGARREPVIPMGRRRPSDLQSFRFGRYTPKLVRSRKSDRPDWASDGVGIESGQDRLGWSVAGGGCEPVEAARRTESLCRVDWLSALWARRHDRPAQCEVEKKSKQVGNESGDERPGNSRHGAAPSVCVDVAETENPDRNQAAGEQADARAGNGLRPYRKLPGIESCSESDCQPNEHCDADDRASDESNSLRNDTPKLTAFHMICPFLFADLAETRSSTGTKRARHQEGAIQKVNNPAWA